MTTTMPRAAAALWRDADINPATLGARIVGYGQHEGGPTVEVDLTDFLVLARLATATRAAPCRCERPAGVEGDSCLKCGREVGRIR